jgi:hypothetical protein
LLNFYFWGPFKSIVYGAPLNDIAELQQMVEDGCELIGNTPGIPGRVRQFLMRIAARYVEAQGKQFEHFS